MARPKAPDYDDQRDRILALATSAFAELGYPSMVASIWYGLMAPAGTPAAMTTQVNAAVNRTLAAPELQKKLEEAGALVMRGSAADFGAFMQKDHARWGDVIRRAGVSTREN